MSEKQDLIKDIKELEGRFDRHLEIYANNGKELARLADAVEKLSTEVQKLQTDTKEIVSVWGHMKWNKKMLIGFLGFLGGLVALALGVLKLLKII